MDLAPECTVRSAPAGRDKPSLAIRRNSLGCRASLLSICIHPRIPPVHPRSREPGRAPGRKQMGQSTFHASNGQETRTMFGRAASFVIGVEDSCLAQWTVSIRSLFRIHMRPIGQLYSKASSILSNRDFPMFEAARVGVSLI